MILLLKSYYSTKSASRYACSRSIRVVVAYYNSSSSTILRAGVQQFRCIMCAVVLALARINSIIFYSTKRVYTRYTGTYFIPYASPTPRQNTELQCMESPLVIYSKWYINWWYFEVYKLDTAATRYSLQRNRLRVRFFL